MPASIKTSRIDFSGGTASVTPLCESFTSNDPLAAATVQAVIDIVDEEKLADHSREVGDYFIGRLEALKEKHPLVRQVRGRGLMIGMELDADEPNVALRLGMLCEQRGVRVDCTDDLQRPLLLQRRSQTGARGMNLFHPAIVANSTHPDDGSPDDRALHIVLKATGE